MAPAIRQRAAGPGEWRLWSGEGPGAPREIVDEVEQASTQPEPHGDPGIFTSVRYPSMFVYRAANPNGAALLMAPGGSLIRVNIGYGSGDIARRLNAAGVTVFMLKYRLPSGRWSGGANTPLQDAQRALRLIRANARHFALDPARIGVIGFSAGGYVAASLATRPDDRVYQPVDAADRESAAPNLAALLFPVISLDQPFAYAVSRDALLGPNPSPDLAARHSPDRHVSSATPPTFLAHASDDTVVRIENALAMYEALRGARVPAQMHLFENGGHGINIGPLEAPRSWLSLFLRWAAERNFARTPRT